VVERDRGLPLGLSPDACGHDLCDDHDAVDLARGVGADRLDPPSRQASSRLSFLPWRSRALPVGVALYAAADDRVHRIARSPIEVACSASGWTARPAIRNEG
jgi:hypothetical protein